MKQATIEIIESVYPHTNADKLELAKVLGYQCVVPKGKYIGGETIVFIQPDCVLPNDDWAIDFKKYAPKRTKAVKLRGEWSEGIIMDVPAELSAPIGFELSEVLNITHYEPPIPNDIQAKGGLPFGIPKTDEERFENLSGKLPFGELVDVTLKIDGQSCSAYYDLDSKQFGITGRTLEMKLDSVNKYTAHVDKYGLTEKLINYCNDNNIGICLRGESYGKGIQGSEINAHAKLNNAIAFFGTWLINERRRANKGDKHYFVNVCEALGLPMVDLIEHDVILTPELISRYSQGITEINGNPFEGVVINHSRGSFKVISKNYDSLK